MRTLFCTLAVTLILAAPKWAGWRRGDQESTQPAARPAAHDATPEAAPEGALDLARIFGALAAQDLPPAAPSPASSQDAQEERNTLLEARRRVQVLERIIAEQTASVDERVDREHGLLQRLAEREAVMADEIALREAELHAMQRELESRLHEEMAEHDLQQAEMQGVLAQKLAALQREMTLEQAELEAEMVRELAVRVAETIREQAELEGEFHTELAQRENELDQELTERDAERAELEMLLRTELENAGQDEDEQEARQLRRELERLRSRLESQTERLERARDRERELQGSWRESRGRREMRPQRPGRAQQSERSERAERPDRPTRPEVLEGVVGVLGIGGGTKETYVGSISPSPRGGVFSVAPSPRSAPNFPVVGGKATAPRAQDSASGGITIIVEEGDVYIQGGGQGINVAPQAGGGIWSVTAPSTGKATYTRVPAPSGVQWEWAGTWLGAAPKASGQDTEKAKSKAKAKSEGKSEGKAKGKSKGKKKDKDPKGSVSVLWPHEGLKVPYSELPVGYFDIDIPELEWTSIGVPLTPMEADEFPEVEIEAFQTPAFEAFEAPEIEGFQVLELGTFGVPVLGIEVFDVPEGKVEHFSFHLEVPGYTQIETVPFEAVSYDSVGYSPLGATAPANSDLLSEILDLVRELKSDMSALREEVKDLHSEVARSPRRGGGGSR